MPDQPSTHPAFCGGDEADVLIASTTPLVVAVITCGPSAGLALRFIDPVTGDDVGVAVPIDAETFVALRRAVAVTLHP